jgi:Arginine deiminase
MWADRAKEEHDVFAETLREHGVRVHYFGQLLAETLELPEGRAFVLDRVCTPETPGPALVQPVRSMLVGLDGPALAEYLVGGVLKPTCGRCGPPACAGTRCEPTTSCCRRCPTTCSRATTRAGSTAGYR